LQKFCGGVLRITFAYKFLILRVSEKLKPKPQYQRPARFPKTNREEETQKLPKPKSVRNFGHF
jgi:hypothetical protein